ncbi:cytochrome c [Methylobacterium oxalidis]|uniref:Alcohol dehydrogenase n=1 Tax=Methylobacterium oxalidis TaxID=944322 RepID=A0A512IX93_9HYPH|nr:cytochrome c [Methylobacterium oxalidis]GEP02340.1 alcohol dehydrogenase [Methylobacterium oxalidis]GJE31153.1 Nicotinate dehydrogenase subunit B [Methylobacterium oxalidis]GLS67719.1 alcohol dehydrogenase [Methylobacterium oxalidis]
MWRRLASRRERNPGRRSPWWRRLIVGFGLLAVAGGAAFFLAWQPAIEPVSTPDRASFQPDQIRKGAALASAGFCSTCHTTDETKPFAGGYPLKTPFGTIYGTNITPDRDTGIGTWSLAAFRRSMREGIDRAGSHLYPAFPYTHFTQLTDGDIEALYAYLMTRDAVRAEAPEPDLPFPYSIRPLLAGWNLLFLRVGPLPAGDSGDPVLERGRYLSEALSHCSACHAPRNALRAERAELHFAGGMAEGWWSPPLDRSSPAPVPWTRETLFNYLHSWDSAHGGAAGPMKPVVAGLGRLPEADVRAIARYVAATMGLPAPDRPAPAEKPTDIAPARADEIHRRGAGIYRGACASCHESGGRVPFTVASLGQHTTLAGPLPDNVIRVILEGVHPPEGEVGAIMPGYAGVLDADQIADLLAYLRVRFTNAPAWPALKDDVRRIGAEEPKG